MQDTSTAQHLDRGLPVADDAIALRPLTLHDRALLEEARADSTITYRFGTQRGSVEDQLRHFVELFDSGRGGALAIAPHRRPAVGAMFLEPIDSGAGEIAYWVFGRHRGHGYAKRGLRLAAPWALRTLGWCRLQLWSERDNEPSLRVAEAAGFVREGVLRSYGVIDGRRCDAVFYSLLPTDMDRIAVKAGRGEP